MKPLRLFARDSGLAVPIGLKEPEDVTLWFRGPWLENIGVALSTLGHACLLGEDPSPQLAWQPTRVKLYTICLVLSQLSGMPQIPVDDDVVALLKHRCADDFEFAVESQASILDGAARKRMLASVGLGG